MELRGGYDVGKCKVYSYVVMGWVVWVVREVGEVMTHTFLSSITIHSDLEWGIHMSDVRDGYLRVCLGEGRLVYTQVGERRRGLEVIAAHERSAVSRIWSQSEITHGGGYFMQVEDTLLGTGRTGNIMSKSTVRVATSLIGQTNRVLDNTWRGQTKWE
ncbi:hypothetical protein Tco_1091852 [Tanacetum coccineum]|uniref:Uncharacterized protein n=1 Tax=Tanacetum coccineum TaxID=301880 RepID=A0ABQ5I9G3_9ASTR